MSNRGALPDLASTGGPLGRRLHAALATPAPDFVAEDAAMLALLAIAAGAAASLLVAQEGLAALLLG
jgi:hypothetical protein